MKTIKLNAWEETFLKKIVAIREREADVRKRLSHLATFSAFIWSSSSFFVAFVTFATYVLVSQT